jgi:hypothetical protein
MVDEVFVEQLAAVVLAKMPRLVPRSSRGGNVGGGGGSWAAASY